MAFKMSRIVTEVATLSCQSATSFSDSGIFLWHIL